MYESSAANISMSPLRTQVVCAERNNAATMRTVQEPLLANAQKECQDCGQLKPLSQFKTNRKIKGGYQTHCRLCQAARQKQYSARYKAKHPERLREYTQHWRETHREEQRKRSRESYHKRRKERYEEHYQARRWSRIKYTYGMSEAEFYELLRSQRGVCAVCARPENSQRGNLHIDHDHRTGKHRGLLCGKCNTALGCANDDPDLLVAMANYLRTHKETK